ncbi:MAG: mucoidy inhibitor MuiA family protein [Pseudomonadota bacterium]
MRLLAALLLLPGVAWAEDIPLRADIGAATVYPKGAQITRTGQIDLPAGDHRLLIPLPGQRSLPEVTLDGAAITGVALLPEAGLDLEALDTPAQAEARAALEAADDAVEDARRAIEAARAAVRAADIRLRWLETLTGGGEGALDAPGDGDTLAGTLDTLATQTAAAEVDRVTASAEVAAAYAAAEDAKAEQKAAIDALDRLRPFLPDTRILAIETRAETAGPVMATIASFDRNAGWQPRYDLRLDTEAGTLTLDRLIELRQDGAEVWRDVAVTLSTDDPRRSTAPSAVFPDPARAAPEPAPEARLETAQAPMLRATPPLIIEDAPEVEARGLSLTYSYPRPVSLRPAAAAILTLDPLELDLDLTVRAVPRRDRTAYLVARMTNGTDEPILPGQATLYRDGARLGEIDLPALAPGADTEIGYGPVDAIRLTWLQLSRGEGDRGIIRTSSTLRERLAFTLENTGTEVTELLTLYALPFSEQEDVDVDVRAEPAPDLRDWEERRGVSGWEMTIGPGETRRVELTVEIDWPEGQNLIWRP